MLNQSLTIARKELVEHGRDTRSLAAAALHTLMGPLVVLLVSVARAGTGPEAAAGLAMMASVFALVSAFTGGMSLAMDSVAGERERRSLLPLLLSSASRSEIVIGKWLAASVLAAAGLALNVAAFVIVLAAVSPGRRLLDADGLAAAAVMIAPLLALALLAAAIEVLVSTMCRSAKESHTSLSAVVFGVMAAGMWLAFRPPTSGLASAVPIAGHQQILRAGLVGGDLSILSCAALALATLGAAALAVACAARGLNRDEVVYGH